MNGKLGYQNPETNSAYLDTEVVEVEGQNVHRERVVAFPSCNFVQSSTDSTYKYYGFATTTGWLIKRKTLATGVWQVVTGEGDYDTAWADRANKIYVYA